MTPQTAAAVVTALLLLGCAKTEPTAPSQISPVLTTEEYVVLAALMDSVLGRAQDTTIVLDDSTDAGMFGGESDSVLTSRLQYVSERLTTLKPETILDFKAKNLSRTYIDNPKSIHPKCVRSTETDVRFPWCQVSRVGFSSDGEQALVYAEVVWAPLAGAGVYYVLANIQGSWVISGSVMVWIS